MHSSQSVQRFVEVEVNRPCKHWVHDVILNKRESESVKLRTDEFVLLPDINAHRRQFKVAYRPQSWGDQRILLPRWAESTLRQDSWVDAFETNDGVCKYADCQHRIFSWLAIVSDHGIRTMRDLRGEHVGMLERLYDTCMKTILKETGVESHRVMCYVNYPPSVYRLHIHFCAPFSVFSAFDAFRMHSLSSIINNLKINSDYYALSDFRIPVHGNSELYQALVKASV